MINQQQIEQLKEEIQRLAAQVDVARLRAIAADLENSLEPTLGDIITQAARYQSGEMSREQELTRNVLGGKLDAQSEVLHRIEASNNRQTQVLEQIAQLLARGNSGDE